MMHKFVKALWALTQRHSGSMSAVLLQKVLEAEFSSWMVRGSSL